jgi:hypothetical protein
LAYGFQVFHSNGNIPLSTRGKYNIKRKEIMIWRKLRKHRNNRETDAPSGSDRKGKLV